MIITLVLLTFVVLVLLGMPVVFAMGIASSWVVLIHDSIPWSMLLHRTYVGIDSWVLLAVPLFIWAGMLMEVGGIGQPLIRLATALVGWIRGGLGMATVATEMLFSGISGSTVADVAAITSLTMPAVRSSGYRPEEFVAIRCSAAAIGILIPPCILMILFAEVAKTSVAALFAAGFLPGLLLAALLMVMIYFRASYLGLDVKSSFSFRELREASYKAIPALGMPVVIFVGILAGWYTATEAGAIAVVYALVVGLFVYRQATLRAIWQTLGKALILSGVIMLLIGFSSIFTYILAVEGITDIVRVIMQPALSHYIPFAILLCLIFAVLSSIIEPLPAGLILIPIFLPIANELHMNVVHFVNLLVLAGGIGLFLPPMGVGLVIGCATARVDAIRVLPAFLPFLAALFVGQLLLIVFPVLTTIVPDWLGLRY